MKVKENSLYHNKVDLQNNSSSDIQHLVLNLSGNCEHNIPKEGLNSRLIVQRATAKLVFINALDTSQSICARTV